MSIALRIVFIPGRFLLNVLVLLLWVFAATLGFMLASCTSGDPLGWAILVVVYLGVIAWPATLAALIGALVVAIRYHPFRDRDQARRLVRTVVAVTLVATFLGAAFGFGNRGSCSFGGGF
jgi:membrane associated rhomboid family serine protease